MKNPFIRTLLAVAALLPIVFVGCAKREVVKESIPATEAKPAVVEPASAPVAVEPAPVTSAEVPAPVAVETTPVTSAEVPAPVAVETAPAPVGKPKDETPKFVEKVNATCALASHAKNQFGNIYFDFDKYGVKPEFEAQMKEFAEWLKQNDLKIYIEGHCDDRGTNEYNLGLGDRRANAAKEFLQTRGVPSRKLQIVSCGEEKPVCAEQNEACWSKNRNAHFVILEK